MWEERSKWTFWRDYIITTMEFPVRFGSRKCWGIVTKITFDSTYRSDGNIAHCRDNWTCSDFKTQQVFPAHYSIRAQHDEGANYILDH
jgi:hypothetical protein